MKKLAALTLALVYVFSFVSCKNASAPWSDSNDQRVPGWDITVSSAQYSVDTSIYSDALNKEKMYTSSVCHLPIIKIDTFEELRQFKLTYAEIVSTYYGDNEASPFEKATSKYDKAFFEDNSLLIVYLTSSSGSYTYDVVDIYNDGKSFTVHVKQTNDPEIVTCDMAAQLITVAVQDSVIVDCESFDADLNNVEN